MTMPLPARPLLYQCPACGCSGLNDLLSSQFGACMHRQVSGVYEALAEGVKEALMITTKSKVIHSTIYAKEPSCEKHNKIS